MPLHPGDSLDRFTILEPLGQGGMGAVYRARDTRLQREVALKVMLGADTRAAPAGAGARSSGTAPPVSTNAIARMFREARAAASLRHPNVVDVYDVGEADAPDGSRIAFLAMELIRGRSLRAIIRDGQLAIEERTRIVTDIARALAAAHAIGIVHRDIKPENVMVREDGCVKVLDFGIAKRQEQTVNPTATTEMLLTATAEGVAVGTPYYMAPEQMRGETVDARVDQFAWGVVAWETFVGTPPWGLGLEAVQLVTAVLTKTPDHLDAIEPKTPPRVVATVARALAKAKEERFESMDRVLAVLEGREPIPAASPLARSVDGVQLVTRSPPAPRSRRALLVATAIAALGVGTAIGVSAGRARKSARATGAPASSASAGKSGCASSAACTQAKGQPARCRDDGVCATLASEDCEVSADPAAIANDETVWFGAMLPAKGDPAMDGTAERRAIDLARQDFDEMMAGIAHAPGTTRARPFGAVLCDDGKDAMRAARHLVDDVKVPAIIGFRSASEITEIGTTLLVPKGVLGIASLVTSPLATRIPSAPGQPRMIWRTTYSSADTARAMGRVVPELFEAQLRAPPAALRQHAPMRVAFVRWKTQGGAVFAELLFNSLSFNGKSAMDNGSSYKEIAVDGSIPDGQRAVAELTAFAPHVVIFVAEPLLQMIDKLEASLPRSAPRPFYLFMTSIPPEELSWIGMSVDRRRRMFGLSPVSTTAVNARFVMHYNEGAAEKITRAFAPNSTYDAFYLLAYATYAAGARPIDGSALARGIESLVPPAAGKRIDVGPAGIFDAFVTLRRGDNIDLNGALGSLDFDPKTGEAPIDQAVLCAALDDTGKAVDNIESGVLFRSASNTLEGTLHCP